jgi:hypothetical protein
VEGDRSHGGSAWGANPPAEDTHAWRQIWRHADWLGLDFVRVELEQRMFEPEQGRFIWDAPEMRILYRILDWCQSRRADVFLQCMWGNVEWNAFPEFRGSPVKRVPSGPYFMESFAGSLTALMQHLLGALTRVTVPQLSEEQAVASDFNQAATVAGGAASFAE